MEPSQRSAFADDDSNIDPVYEYKEYSKGPSGIRFLSLEDQHVASPPAPITFFRQDHSSEEQMVSAQNSRAYSSPSPPIIKNLQTLNSFEVSKWSDPFDSSWTVNEANGDVTKTSDYGSFRSDLSPLPPPPPQSPRPASPLPLPEMGKITKSSSPQASLQDTKSSETMSDSWDLEDGRYVRRGHESIDDSIVACGFGLSKRCLALSVAFFCWLFAFESGLVIGAFVWSPATAIDRIVSAVEESATAAPSVTHTPTAAPSPSPSPVPTALPTKITWPELPSTELTVGAFYYPWHKDDFHRDQGYLREQLDPPQQPSLGEYDDSDPQVVAKHLAWSRQANIRLWITSWWGEGSREDITTRDVILQHEKLEDHKIALLYESTGRVKVAEDHTLQRVVPDVQYMCSTYWNHTNYYKIDGRPVVFLYLSRKLESIGVLGRVTELFRETALAECGQDVYLVGDHAFSDAPLKSDAYPAFAQLDAVVNYDGYGSAGVTGFAGAEGVKAHYTAQRQWKEAANHVGCAYISAASPGYNDLGVRPEAKHAPLSRRLNVDSEPGTYFREALSYAKTLTQESTGNLMVVNSFNEWHEDTQIEPTTGESTNFPIKMTHGHDYHGYGELYLDILSQETRANTTSS